jgi:hypothetical protein
MLADRTPVQADQAEFSAKVLPGRQSECHRNTNLDSHVYQSVDYTDKRQSETFMGFSQHDLCHPATADELCQYLPFHGRP